MCGGGGGDTTNVTETGLGDEQTKEIMAGQGTIRADIDGFQDSAEINYDKIVGKFDDQNTTLDTRFDSVDSGLTGISGDVTDGFAGVTSEISGLNTSVDNRLDQTDENISTGFTNTANAIETGVTTLGNTVDTRAGEINSNVKTGFDTTNTNLATGFTGLSDQMDINDATLLANQTEGFSDVGTKVTESEKNLSGQLTDTSKNVLADTKIIQDLVNKYGGDAATYYAALNAGQDVIRENQGGLQTAFDGFSTDFNDYSTLANQTRSDLGQTVIGGFDTMGQIMGNQADATADGFASVGKDVAGVSKGIADVTSDVASGASTSEQNFGDIAKSISGVSSDISGVSKDISGVGSDVAESAAANETNFASAATDIATGFDDSSEEGAARKKSFISTLDSVRKILQADTGNLDASVKANYESLSGSFDDQGNLIAQTAGDNGSSITRALSEQGELFIAKFDAQGARTDQQTLDLNSLMNNVSSFETNTSDQFNTIFGDAEVAAESRTSILDAFATTNGLIGDVGTGVNAELSASFDSLQSSFDDQGNLIRSEITESGSELRRDLDAQGNLITTELDAAGQVINQSSLNVADISSQLNGMQAGLGDTISTAFNGIQQSSDELRSNLVGNLSGLRDIMTTQGDTMGADLKDKFGSLLSAFDDNGDLIRSTVSDTGDFIFREINASGELVVSTVDDATGELIESNKFNADLLTTDFDSRFSSTDEFLQAIDASISQVGGDIDQGLLGMASGLQEGFTSRFDEMSDQERAGRQEFTNRLNMVKGMLEEDVANLDQGLRGRMSALSESFDDEGLLIANAIDNNGNMLKRTIDDSGSLVLSTYSSMNGSLLDQQSLDINRLMKEISANRLTQGSNANMGGRSPTAGAPAPASVYSGFASPYAQTY